MNCSDGIADAARVRELVDGAASGVPGALLILSEIGDARAFDGLMEALEAENPGVRQAALDALGLIGDVRAVRTVTQLLADEDRKVRSCAVACLAELGSTEAADALAAMLDDEAVHVEAALALAWLREERAFAPLVALLPGPQRTFAQNIARTPSTALARLGDEAAVPHLIAALEHLTELWAEAEEPLWWTRFEAEDIARTLDWFGGEAAERAVHAADERFGGFTRGVPLLLEGYEHVFSSPMTFFAQFRLPDEPLRMAYLFIDPQGGVQASNDGDSAVFVQPGGAPERFELRRSGPAYVSDLGAELRTFKPRRRRGLVESAPLLTEGRDPLDWNRRAGESAGPWHRFGAA